LAARQKLLDRLPVTGEILRGSLLQRTIRNHANGCAKCASGEGARLYQITTIGGTMAKKKDASYRDHVNSDSLSFCQTMWKECWLDCYQSTAGTT
jgi:hypothetical protein